MWAPDRADRPFRGRLTLALQPVGRRPHAHGIFAFPDRPASDAQALTAAVKAGWLKVLQRNPGPGLCEELAHVEVVEDPEKVAIYCVQHLDDHDGREIHWPGERPTRSRAQRPASPSGSRVHSAPTEWTSGAKASARAVPALPTPAIQWGADQRARLLQKVCSLRNIPQLGRDDHRVYQAIVMRAVDHGWCVLPLSVLSAELQINRGNVSRALGHLQKVGVIDRQRHSSAAHVIVLRVEEHSAAAPLQSRAIPTPEVHD